ncbi:fimbrial biogenesis chaperone [Collimonas sp.]|jgi:P pilus assembly chaperone PapD|uniref:fimbrial biogenesis chaperone n=1 Tax=Collimonas sp. TaxID=1963772 RepID=UPI002CBFB9A4|nr:fimbria/pilus periplasmic chaperone [Collimonas sp.]HWX00569.1 fimbria/pilus periplasmic chaperone [Collimonas sp.]
MNKKTAAAMAGIIGILISWATPSMAANMSVTPLRLDLAENKSAVVTISNDSDQALDLAVNAMTWTQDDAAADQHEKTDALAFYPAAFSLAPHAKRSIRVSAKPGAARPAVEAAYRLYITELAPAQRAEHGEAIQLEVRFGVPVFIRQGKAAPALSAVAVTGSPGTVDVKLKNTGNAHARIEAIRSKPEGINENKFQQWYLLPAAERSYRLQVTPALCQESDLKVVLQIRADSRVIPVSIALPAETCSAK